MCGHFHRAHQLYSSDLIGGQAVSLVDTFRSHGKDDEVYINTGSWTVSADYLVCHEDGVMELLDWRQERKKLGLTSFPRVTDDNQNAHMRPKTIQAVTEMIEMLEINRTIDLGADNSSITLLNPDFRPA